MHVGWQKAGRDTGGQSIELEAHTPGLWRSYNLTSDVLPHGAKIDAHHCSHVATCSDRSLGYRGEGALGCPQYLYAAIVANTFQRHRTADASPNLNLNLVPATSRCTEERNGWGRSKPLPRGRVRGIKGVEDILEGLD